jgi:HD-GYP domain-containing protein (c-di-GMP phosphodiesterase class II)
MTSRRPYRQAMSREQASIEIARHSGTQFDPSVVEAFLVMLRRSPEGMYEEHEAYGPHVEESHAEEVVGEPAAVPSETV